ncbi:MAG: LUD domain-containing protein [Flavipsychrobacter sp.]
MSTLKTSKSKENILSKIRKSLNKDQIDMPYPEVEQRAKEEIYAPDSNSLEEIFAENFNQLGGKFVFCEDETALLNNIVKLHENLGWKHMLCSEKELLTLLNNNQLNIAESSEVEIEHADACITGCETVVARTGSVILSSKQNMGRTSSIYYPVHIIVAYTDQVVNDIKDAINHIQKKYGDNIPSMINLNTGPSRTADIEKTLVVGVHGPGEVFCFLVNR